MGQLTLMISCILLILMSIIFIIIEIRAKFDRSFLVFGVVNLMICFFCAIDIMIQPSKQILHWTVFQHIIATFFPPISFWLVMVIIKNTDKAIIKGLFLLSTVFSILFMTGIMLQSSEDGVVSTLIYNITFVPFIVITQVYLFVNLIQNRKKVPVNQRYSVYFYLLGITMLVTGSLLDLLTVMFELHSLFPSYSILGAIGFSAIVTIMFTEKLTSLIKEREVTFSKLRDAYRDLEEVQSLKELGQSSAIINHEIRNYAAAISGYAEILKMSNTLDEHSQKIVNRISDCIIRLTSFSNDILEFSKSKILKDKRLINLNTLINECVEVHFASCKEKFVIEKNDIDANVNGEKNKLDQVFINIFKNAIEAKAQNIRIGLRATESVLFCNVEDDGVGCTQEQVEQIFKSFYTTKKNVGGTGLGMCVVRSVIEVHGGHVSAYSKNGLGRGEQGLSLHITFPRYENKGIDLEKKHDIILVKEDIRDLAFIFKVFQNVLVNPHVMQTVDEIDNRMIGRPNLVVLAGPKQLAVLQTKCDVGLKAYAIVEGVNHLPFIVNENGDEFPMIFNEEYLIKNIINISKPALTTCAG